MVEAFFQRVKPPLIVVKTPQEEVYEVWLPFIQILEGVIPVQHLGTYHAHVGIRIQIVAQLSDDAFGNDHVGIENKEILAGFASFDGPVMGLAVTQVLTGVMVENGSLVKGEGQGHRRIVDHIKLHVQGRIQKT
jgi:hypothetical protein